MKLPRMELKRARIEIIPMIDTIFFLLVFFMISSLSKIQMAAHRVDLPESTTAALKPTEKVVVSVSKEGNYYIDRQQVSEAQIRILVAAKVAENPDIAVVLNCDKNQHIAQFVRAFDLVKQANPGSVMVATAPSTGEEGSL